MTVQTAGDQKVVSLRKRYTLGPLVDLEHSFIWIASQACATGEKVCGGSYTEC